MKTLIAIPCMDTVPVQFMQSLLYLEKIGDVRTAIESGSLIYDSRNLLLETAIHGEFDRILWFDSDMEFQPDTMQRLCNDIDDSGCDIVSGLYIKRKPPFDPVIFSECCLRQEGEWKMPSHKCYKDYPRDQLFEVEAFGFGCVMMTMDAVKKITDAFGTRLFMPLPGFGEDLSFCMRARNVGIKLWCDSRIVLGHIGMEGHYPKA